MSSHFARRMVRVQLENRVHSVVSFLPGITREHLEDGDSVKRSKGFI
jgi:hypothetical protein